MKDPFMKVIGQTLVSVDVSLEEYVMLEFENGRILKVTLDINEFGGCEGLEAEIEDDED